MISYEPLWEMLAERNISNADLRKQIGIAPNTFTRMKKGEEVSVAVLTKICATLNCTYGDVIRYIPVEGKKQ